MAINSIITRNYNSILSTLDGMNLTVQEFESLVDELLRDTQMIVGSEWVGRDAQSASLAIQSYSALLKRKAEQLKEANNILVEDTRAMQEQENSSEKLFNDWY